MTENEQIATPPSDGIWGTIDGLPVTDEVIERLVADAEAGFPHAAARPVGRPRTVGTKTAARTVTVRLDEDQASAVRKRADHDHISASEVMRRALDHYLAS